MSASAHSSPAVVLSTRPLGEADLLVALLTPGLGKVRAAARNARRSRRRFAGGLPGGSIGEATLGRGRGGLWRLEGFRLLRDPSVLGRDLTRLGYAAYLCEITDAMLPEPEPDPRVFVALTRALGEVLDAPPGPATLRRYEFRLLQALGLLPTLTACCVCGEPTAVDPAQVPDAPFDPDRGGVLCPEHATGAARMPAEVIDLASRLVDDDADAPAALAAAPAPVRRAVRDLGQALIRPHLRRPLRSLEFFAKLGQGSRDGLS